MEILQTGLSLSTKVLSRFLRLYERQLLQNLWSTLAESVSNRIEDKDFQEKMTFFVPTKIMLEHETTRKKISNQSSDAAQNR